MKYRNRTSPCIRTNRYDFFLNTDLYKVDNLIFNSGTVESRLSVIILQGAFMFKTRTTISLLPHKFSLLYSRQYNNILLCIPYMYIISLFRILISWTIFFLLADIRYIILSELWCFGDTSVSCNISGISRSDKVANTFLVSHYHISSASQIMVLHNFGGVSTKCQIYNIWSDRNRIVVIIHHFVFIIGGDIFE